MRLRSTLLLPLLLVTSGLLFSPAPARAEAPKTEKKLAVALFAGGCFWCLEKPFDAALGVLDTTSGYTGGHTKNPTYREVSAGKTGHTEVVRVVFDPERTSYEKLLEIFWRNIDPLTANAQFCDHGSQYRSGLFVMNEAQRRAAIASREALTASARLPGPIVTEITRAGPFYPAEDYHQDYYRKNPIRYRFYRSRCGRDARLEALWGPPEKQ